MTRARTASLGVGNLTAIQPLLGAVLMLCVSLVQGARTTLGMIFQRTHRDWHTADTHDDPPQAKSGIQSQESHTTHGVILGLFPRISVGTSRGLSIDPLDTNKEDSRHKAENDLVAVEAPKALSLSFRRHGSVRAGTQGRHTPATNPARVCASRD